MTPTFRLAFSCMHLELDIVPPEVLVRVLEVPLVPISIALRLAAEGEKFYTAAAGREGNPLGVRAFATMLKNSPTLLVR